MRCLLSKSLLDRGFFSNKKEANDNSIEVPNYSWSGQRKPPSYLNKLIFPEEFLTCLRTIAMREDEIFKVTSLLQEVHHVSLVLHHICVFWVTYICSSKLVESDGERQPSDVEVRAAVWEACGDSGALQMLVDLLSTRYSTWIID